jgi:hypothetical protein
LIFGKHEAKRADANEIAGKGLTEEGNILSLLGVGPFADESLKLSRSVFHGCVSFALGLSSNRGVVCSPQVSFSP